jgi:hypothetical protein
MAYERLLELIRHLLSQVVVDEQWYLAQYPDVAEAIAKGTKTSATHTSSTMDTLRIACLF